MKTIIISVFILALMVTVPLQAAGKEESPKGSAKEQVETGKGLLDPEEEIAFDSLGQCMSIQRTEDIISLCKFLRFQDLLADFGGNLGQCLQLFSTSD
jgi:hypothetical protein